MITRDEYKTIRQERHLIVLDTNILLELYRQPANVSRDIIAEFQKIADKVYIPHRVYEEYILADTFSDIIQIFRLPF